MTSPASIPDLDRAIGFTLPNCNARGRVARLGPVLEEILSAHSYPQPIERVLAETLALTALLGSILKDADGQLTLQAQAENGIISMMVCDYRGGALRGYLQFDADRVSELGESPTLQDLFGKGYLAITFDQSASSERYQGIVALEGDSLSAAAESYFMQSDQIPSLVRIGVQHQANGKCIVGGMFLQHLPTGEVGQERLHARETHADWERVAMLGDTVGVGELADGNLPLDDLLWRLFNEEPEVRLVSEAKLSRGCRCDPDYIKQVLSKFPEVELTEMADESGVITVDCAFCSKNFPISAANPVSASL